jgi:hypothetical protein
MTIFFHHIRLKISTFKHLIMLKLRISFPKNHNLIFRSEGIFILPPVIHVLTANRQDPLQSILKCCYVLPQ